MYQEEYDCRVLSARAFIVQNWGLLFETERQGCMIATYFNDIDT